MSNNKIDSEKQEFQSTNTQIDSQSEDDEDENANKSVIKQKTNNDFLNTFKSFAKRSKTLSDDDDFDMANQTDIQYGNLTKNYDPSRSVNRTTSDQLNLVIVDDDEDYTYKVYQSLFKNNKKNDSQTKNDLNEINLIRKSSLIKLIERNRSNQICCPFDEIVYEQLFFETNDISNKEIELITRRRHKMKQLLLDNLKLFEFMVYKEKNNSFDYLLPNCISTFLMQFFFDIFPPSELKMFSSNTLEIVLKLKSLFKPQIHLDSNLKIAHILEDILWNCFALFKFKFDKLYTVGFVNYFNSLFIILNAFKDDHYFLSLKLDVGIRKLAPYFIQALILNGLFTLNDFKQFLKFSETSNESNSIVQSKITSNFPMNLRNLCRIKIKQTMREFNSIAVDSLKQDDSIKRFLLFNSEFESYYNENKCLIKF